MKPDTVEIQLESVEGTPESIYSVSTTITAYLSDGGTIDRNTLIFDCNPIGDNYRGTYLQVRFSDWSTVARIRDFLAHHFSDYEGTRRTLTVPIDEGYYSLTPEGGGRHHESEDFDEITISANGTRIDFGGVASMTPNIRTYERIVDGEPQDDNNASKLLSFLNEITSDYPLTQKSLADDEEQVLARDVHRLFNPNSVCAQLNAIAEPEDDIYKDYQKSVREFTDREYHDTVRDVGRATEELINRLCHDLYDQGDVPESTIGRINKLDKSESGVPSYIGKSLSPLWWLRNKANHATDYDITKGDAHFALLCFQIATERYVEEYLDAEVVY